MNEKQIKLLSEAPVVQAILKLSIPVVLGMMVQVFYNLVDMYFIGQLGDANQLAAANLTTPIFMIMMAISGIIGTGASSYISRCLGRKDYEEANRTLTTGIFIVLILAIFVMLIGLIFLSPLIHLLGASNQTYPFAFDYSFVLFLGSIFIMCSFTMGQLLRSEGAAVPSIIGMALGTVTNIILDPIFIFVFKMGITGAAIATVLGNAVSLFYYIYYYSSGKSNVKIHKRYFGWKKIICKEIFFIGTPASLNQVLMSVALIISNNLASGYGDVVVAGMGVSSKIIMIGTFIFIGFSAGCQPLIGFNYGAKNISRIKDVIKSAMIITSSIGLLLLVVFYFSASFLIQVFANNMQDVVTNGVIILHASMWSLIMIGPQMLATVTVQAFGKAKASLLLSIARQGLFFIPLLIILNKLFAFNGLIYAQPISDTMTVILALTVLKTVFTKIEKENFDQTVIPQND